MSHHYDSSIQTFLPGSFPKVPWFETSDQKLLAISRLLNWCLLSSAL